MSASDCVCQLGWAGAACDVCAVGFYGSSCNETCSTCIGLCYSGVDGNCTGMWNRTHYHTVTVA